MSSWNRGNRSNAGIPIWIWILVIIILVACAFYGWDAWAQEVAKVAVTATGTDATTPPVLADDPWWSDLASSALSIGGTVLAAVGTWAAWRAIDWIEAKTGHEIAQKNGIAAKIIDSAFYRGIGWAQLEARKRLGLKPEENVVVDDEDMAELVSEYVRSQVSGKLAQIGIPISRLPEMAKARFQSPGFTPVLGPAVEGVAGSALDMGTQILSGIVTAGVGGQKIPGVVRGASEAADIDERFRKRAGYDVPARGPVRPGRER